MEAVTVKMMQSTGEWTPSSPFHSACEEGGSRGSAVGVGRYAFLEGRLVNVRSGGGGRDKFRSWRQGRGELNNAWTAFVCSVVS